MSEALLNIDSKSGVLDYQLLVERVRQLVLSGDDPDKAGRILGKKAVWGGLSPEQCLEWSRLAQICGDHDLASDILNTLHRTRPEYADAWKEHVALLVMLQKKEQLVALKALAGQVAPESLPVFSASGADVLPSDVDAQENDIDSPFVHLKHEQELIDLYARLFRGRQECFARQWANTKEKTSGYVPVRRPMTEKDIRDHLRGTKTYGIYLLHEDSRVSVGVIDVDLNKGLRRSTLNTAQKNIIRREQHYLFQQIRERSSAEGLFCLAEFSGGKGYHFWYFFQEPIPAARVKNLLSGITQHLARDLTCFQLEVFPKQDHLRGKGLGNLVKLPLGVHRKTGRLSYFIPKIQGDVWAQMAVLKNIEPVSESVVTVQEKQSRDAVVSLHPRYEEWCTTYPELGTLVNMCPALGQVIALCREGRPLSLKEEKVVFGTIAFLTRGKLLVHALLKDQPEYNPHLVDLKLSRLRGTPLGCKRIHALLECTLDYCVFESPEPYAHPLLFCKKWLPSDMTRSEKTENLQDALMQLQHSLDVVRLFLPKPGK